MESSPSKKRKTSPTTSLPIDAPATPSRIPVRKDGAKTLPGRRPSFASPTKASIARHNPHLLARPSSAGNGAERLGSRGRNLDEVFAKVLKEVRPSIEGIGVNREDGSELSTTQENEIPDEEIIASHTPKSIRSVGGRLSAKPRRISLSPFKQAPRPFDGHTEEPQEHVNPFKKSGLRRSPIASQEELVLQENINPFQKRGLRRSPISSHPLNTLQQGSVPPEPSNTSTEQFPPQTVSAAFRKDPTPIEDIEPPTVQNQQPFSRALENILDNPSRQRKSQLSPSFSHFSAQATAQLKPSLLEEPELPPTPTERGIPDPIVTTPPTGIHDTPSKRAKRDKSRAKKLKSSPLKPQDPAPEPAKDAEPNAQDEPQRKEKRRKSARFIVPDDPHAAKKKELDDLLKELQRLEADVAITSRENERLRLHHESKRSPPSGSTISEELSDVLLRSTAPEPPSKPEPKPKSIFKSIGSFLPFSSRRKVRHPVALLDKPIPSHLPIAVDNPLPYLQAFSPLKYTSNITILPSEAVSPDLASQDAEQPALQRHLINASHLSGLFNARIAMTVDSSLLSILSLEILKLDLAAEKELGTFMRESSREDTAVNRDIGVVCWAMGRWVETSILRARFWCAIDHQFSTPEARAKSLQRKKKKRKLQKLVTEDDDPVSLGGDGEDEETRKQTWTRRQLLPHMGSTAMEIATDDVELMFEWKVSFDWTGEVESTISASARLPKSWQQSDDRKSLLRIPETFDRLVKQKGPLAAVRAVVGLLMPVS